MNLQLDLEAHEVRNLNMLVIYTRNVQQGVSTMKEGYCEYT
jgi:hypothetical protein